VRRRPKYSLGGDVAMFIEAFLVHGPGDVSGQPFRLTKEEKRFLLWAYEVDSKGRRVVRRALRGLPKGSRKTEWAAALAIAELAGPVAFSHWEERDGRKVPRGERRHDPYVVAAASTYEQADLLFGAARAMIEQGPLADFFDLFDREIQLKHEPGVMVRVPAVAGANDGLRPTFCVFDETHEWTAGKQRVHLVLENGLAKRAGAWSLSITTAGNPKVESVALTQYQYGKRVEAGEIDDPSFLFDWREPKVNLDDLQDDGTLRATVKNANPEPWKRTDDLVARFREIPIHEFARYHLNLWCEPDEERWLPPGVWDDLASDRTVPPSKDTKIVLGFDGSYSGDSTALVACTVEETPHLWLVGLWEHPGGNVAWQVDIDEVEATVFRMFDQYEVVEMSADPPFWSQQLQRWAELFGEDRVIAFNTFVRKRMAAACSGFYQTVTQAGLTHDGAPGLARHLDAATVKETAQGAYITKESKSSPRKIDAAVASVIAVARSQFHHQNPKKPASVGVFAL
jgi:phage terminase large subunit-like protein